jgi:hypothetical protein
MGFSLRVGSVASNVQSVVNHKPIEMDILCNFAHIFIFDFPKMLVNSIIASTSSAELKNGKRLVRKLNRITPHDQMSISRS